MARLKLLPRLAVSFSLSIDSKAKVKLDNLSRGGKDRRQMAPKADDHDTEWQGKVVPFGIPICRLTN